MTGGINKALTPGNRPIPVMLKDLVTIRQGITTYKYGHYTFSKFRTCGIVLMVDEKATIPIFEMSCMFDADSKITCLFPTIGENIMCANLKNGDVVTVVGKFQPLQQTRRLQLTSVIIESKKIKDQETLRSLFQLDIQFCTNFYEYIVKFLQTPDLTAPEMLRRIEYESLTPESDNFARPQVPGTQDNSSASELSSASNNGSIQRPKSESSSQIMSTPRRPQCDVKNPMKRTYSHPFNTPQTSDRYPEPEEKKSKKSTLAAYIISIIEAKKNTDKEEWKGITLDEIISRTFTTEDNVKEAIMDLSICNRIQQPTPGVFDLID
uniref:RPA_C domain-containing protein n=1 Tax=Strongyloides papillosus TaxID=174720 RepID=A0A0N5C2M2_STREA